MTGNARCPAGFNIGMRTRQSISPAGARGIIFFTEIREISVGAQERMSGNIYGRQGKQIDQRVNCTLGTSVTVCMCRSIRSS
jgi:hypothetical protein